MDPAWFYCCQVWKGLVASAESETWSGEALRLVGRVHNGDLRLERSHWMSPPKRGAFILENSHLQKNHTELMQPRTLKEALHAMLRFADMAAAHKLFLVAGSPLL
jgi:hypothetical protein